MDIQKDRIACPTCGRKRTWDKDNLHRPFCSERCRLIDLGEWVSESYTIPADDSRKQ